MNLYTYHIIIYKWTAIGYKPCNWKCCIFWWPVRNCTTVFCVPEECKKSNIRRQKCKGNKRGQIIILVMWLTNQSNFLSTFLVYYCYLVGSLHSRIHCRYQSANHQIDTNMNKWEQPKSKNYKFSQILSKSLTTGSGASCCLHMIHGTPVFRPTAIAAAHFV